MKYIQLNLAHVSQVERLILNMVLSKNFYFVSLRIIFYQGFRFVFGDTLF